MKIENKNKDDISFGKEGVNEKIKQNTKYRKIQIAKKTKIFLYIKNFQKFNKILLFLQSKKK